ncbi:MULTISPECIES: GTP cyclohydrolase II [Yersinia pseudotuberculosis complex]|uniref:GTP cyclohydrolase-2 n=1 Tax=Yersinia pseudotuberculosis serotype O:1b (strain IP 31758) TaxID=349747 RepID=A0A0U1QTK1_YERP3|nr:MULTISPECIES: GTP cyclohydrolase II [Yersinia pseudotuberculosis complex]ABS45710.1 GTP cyclohydrolase II domain protein [Yersinia pseudotuberculosis IP 31758]MCE4113215.1 GTP cyclohydrolase II [Yersinia pseudotuberculosis]RYC26231.1 GTP cyclohydrolase II [Yersinia pseudotuberculosis]UFA64054.1 GTP cyclohydrolase II RibA [Yersinia pseudotuberculosis]WLF06016.1 GTP cyclohydrolase II [Yersinia pseudotuberculosis]
MLEISIRNSTSIPLKSVKNPTEFITFLGFPADQEHIAIRIGKWSKEVTPLVRIHSECMTGDVFHSLRCDCGEQLAEALALLDVQGGVLLYLRQEGRGIGLYNKIDAYELQSEGLDTYQANQQLGFSTDNRDFSIAAQMLLAIGVSRVRLLTNNPEKKWQLESNGIEIQEVINTSTFLNEFNKNYLHAKKEKTAHSLKL